jgi:hypothetical protein
VKLPRLLPVALAVCATGAIGAVPRAVSAAEETKCVGVVVDPVGSGSTRSADTFCATVAADATGLTVLNARADALNRPRPRLNTDGLVCAVDGFPAEPACGESDGNGGFRYWSYWHKAPGSSAWTYSQVGVTTYKPVNGTVEGWAFQDGGKERGRKPPESTFATICPDAVKPSPSATPTAVAGPTQSAAGTTPRAATPTSRTSRSAATRATRAGATVHASATRVTTPATSAVSATASAAAPSTAASTAEPTPSAPPVPTEMPSSPVLVAAVPDAPRRSSDGGVPWGLVGGGAGVLALGVATAIRARRS